MKFFSDGYVTIVAKSKKEAVQLYLEQDFGDEETIEFLEEIDPTRKTMLFPIDELPKKYYDEDKYPRKDWCGLYIGVEIPLIEAMKYKKEKPPYVLCVSSDLV